MIPEHYWRILRNWYWLIGGVSLACALIAAAALPALLNGGGSGHGSSVTLGVTRLVSFSGTTVAGEGDGEAMASYTTNIAERGSSPQFLSTLKGALEEKGVTLKGDPSFTANEGLFRITIEATADVPNDAQVIADTAAEQLIADTTAVLRSRSRRPPTSSRRSSCHGSPSSIRIAPTGCSSWANRPCARRWMV